MADGTLQILGLGTSAVPLEYSVSGNQGLDLIAVQADFDGSATVFDFQAVVEIFSAAGEVMARGVGPTITAGDSASVTFAPFLGEDLAGAAPVLTLDQVVVALNPTAWYKLSETSGAVAHDSSGNGLDLSVQAGGYVAPTWGQPAGPPGTTSASFTAGSPGAQVARPSFAALSGDFTVLVFANRSGSLAPANPVKFLVGQGDPIVLHQAGFMLEVEAFNEGSRNHGAVIIGNSTTPLNVLETDAVVPVDTWHLHGVTRQAGIFKQWLDGVQQATTFNGAYDASGGFWLGTDTTAPSTDIAALMSYCMVWTTRALTGTEIATIAAAAGF